MDWDVAIERNREALKRILAMLVAMVGLADGETTLPRRSHRAILALLRPVEAAARRLVIVVARDLVVSPRPRKVKPLPDTVFVRTGKGTGIVLPYGVKPSAILPNLVLRRAAPRTVALPLLDPLPKWPGGRHRQVGGVPRILAPGYSEPRFIPGRCRLSPDGRIDATRLALRLQAVGRALDDLPREARRFARWRRRAAAAGAQNLESGAAGKVRRVWPLRPGRPPGSCRGPAHQVHEVLADLQYFAFRALERRDSS